MNHSINAEEERGPGATCPHSIGPRLNKIILLNSKKLETCADENQDRNSRASERLIHLPVGRSDSLNDSSKVSSMLGNFFISPNLFKKKPNDSSKIPFFRISSERRKGSHPVHKRVKVSKKRFSKSAAGRRTLQKSRKDPKQIVKKKQLLEHRIMTETILDQLKSHSQTKPIYRQKFLERTLGDKGPKRPSHESKFVCKVLESDFKSLLFPNSTVPNDRSKIKAIKMVPETTNRPLNFCDILASHHYRFSSVVEKYV